MQLDGLIPSLQNWDRVLFALYYHIILVWLGIQKGLFKSENLAIFALYLFATCTQLDSSFENFCIHLLSCETNTVQLSVWGLCRNILN